MVSQTGAYIFSPKGRDWSWLERHRRKWMMFLRIFLMKTGQVGDYRLSGKIMKANDLDKLYYFTDLKIQPYIKGDDFPY